jgi:molecular chaperone DnaK (HSP70)
MMRLVCFAFLFVLSFSLRAQVVEDTRAMSAGSKPALTVILPGADTKLADAAWKEFIKPYGKLTKVKKAKESVVLGAQVLDIGGVNRLDIYNLSEPTPEGAKMVVWIDMGGGFLSATTFPKEYAAAVKFLQEYAHKVRVDQISTELEMQQKQLSKLQGNLAKLQRENENLHKIIEDSKKRIAQAEQDIEKNLANQENAQKEIEAQAAEVDKVSKHLEDTKARKPQ